ncbi:putative methyltransferase family protein [Theileria parva strain Muguga]|uniref:Ribosomal RNA-processing protein 8 n=1 Tax=Theileria parva TaxID=5875 RepID=Q4N045_THEPA|nr:putative methyltransferase family protein [Theileria parva strain Muguga]EAN31044.1 putative methyltransferase family protein [Theileria parva strain Muguga]|eukprot:XP_763327.1 hypothetical protein [Theileria parva strain Muguga]
MGKKGKRVRRMGKRGLEEIRSRLSGSRFRCINEKLYKCKSDISFTMFNSDPKLYSAYHEGYRNQVLTWPYNPVDKVIQWLKQRQELVNIGDFGCGDALIAKTFTKKVYSYDLVATNEHVTACNIKRVPLETGVLDVVIFCLSLMGTDWPLFILEATRTTKIKGRLKIVEVTSRISNPKEFINFITSFGYALHSSNHNTTGDYFVWFEFVLEDRKEIKEDKLLQYNHLLTPCLYKQR